jgi:hypothetical protein
MRKIRGCEVREEEGERLKGAKNVEKNVYQSIVALENGRLN